MVSDRLFDRACDDLQAQTKKVFELVQSHNALLTRHNALVEAVAWEREVEWLNDLIPEQYACVSEIAPEEEEISVSYFEARSEVDRLIARGNGWRWPAPQQ